jgi:hypothetical protein
MHYAPDWVLRAAGDLKHTQGLVMAALELPVHSFVLAARCPALLRARRAQDGVWSGAAARGILHKV